MSPQRGRTCSQHSQALVMLEGPSVLYLPASTLPAREHQAREQAPEAFAACLPGTASCALRAIHVKRQLWAPESQGQYDKDSSKDRAKVPRTPMLGVGTVCGYRASRWLRLQMLQGHEGGDVGGEEGTHQSPDAAAGPERIHRARRPGIDYKPRCSGLRAEPLMVHCWIPERGTVCQNDGKQSGAVLRTPPLEKDTSGFEPQPPC